MKLAIVGSRTFNDYEFLFNTIHNIEDFRIIDIECIISGGAKGADSLAEKFANFAKLNPSYKYILVGDLTTNVIIYPVYEAKLEAIEEK